MAIITYKLKPYKSLKGKKHFIMQVNDMTLEGQKSRGRDSNDSYGWKIYVYHDNKLQETKFYRKPTETVEYLNAYIEVARTPIDWVVV